MSATSSLGRLTAAGLGSGSRPPREQRRKPVECGSWWWRRGCKAPWSQLGVTEQHLDDADVGVLFQQVDGEAVPQRVHRHPLLDPGGLSGSVDGAVDLTGRE